MSPEYEEPALADTRGDAQWSEGDPFTGVPWTDLLLFYWTSFKQTPLLADAAEVWYGSVAWGATTSWPYYVWPVRSDN